MPLIDYAVPVSAAGTMLSAAIACATYVTSTMQRNRVAASASGGQTRENIWEIWFSTQIVGPGN